MNLAAPLTDKANALEAIAACEQAYLTATVCSDDCNFLIQEQPDFIHLTARGSKSPQDWVSDFDALLVPIGGGRIHEGIWRSYQNVSSELRSKLKALPRKPLVCDGHSRGGGHCQYAAFDLNGEYDIARVISFGGLRWADNALAANYNRWLKDKTIRYVNALDPVPRVPFSALGFAHVGHEAYLPSVGGMVVDPNLFELAHQDIVSAVENAKQGQFDDFAEHHAETYAFRIGSL